MAQDWFYSRAGGSQTGPVSMADLQRLAREGTLLPTDLLWQEGLPSWQPASSVPGVFPATSPEPARVASPSRSETPPERDRERAPRSSGPSAFAGGLDSPKLWELIKWGTLGLGALLLFSSFLAGILYGPGLGLGALFFAVCSRIAQAEQHQRERK